MFISGNQASAGGGAVQRGDAQAQVVQQRMVTDPNLHLIDGLTLVPNQLKYFVDGLHPNDAGFKQYASNLAAKLSQ